MASTVNRDNTLRMLWVIGLTFLLGGVLFAWSHVLFPVLVAFLIAYLIHPLASFFERHQMPRFLGFLLFLFLLIGFFLVLTLVFLPAIIHEFMLFGQKFFSWRVALVKSIGSMLLALQNRFPESYPLLQERLTQWFQENLGSLTQHLVDWLGGMINSTISLAGVFVNLILIPVIAAYLTVDFHKFVNAVQRLIPRPVLPTVEKVILDVDKVLKDFLLGQFLVAGVLGIMYTVGLFLVQAPLALVIGPLAGFLALVPYLGLVFGMGTALLLTFLEYQDFWHLVGVLATFAVAQSIEGWILTPRIIGKRVGLHPVWVLVALLLGGELFGLPGIVVGVPVAAALRVVLQHALEAYRASFLYKGAEL